MTFRESSEAEAGIWQKLANAIGIFNTNYECAPPQFQHCLADNGGAECIEHCRATDEDGDHYELSTTGCDDVVHAVPGGAVKVQWASWAQTAFKGLDDEDEMIHHSLLPLSGRIETEAPESTSLPILPFREGLTNKAYMYQAIPSDAIDIALVKNLRSLSEDASHVLGLRRIEPGRYEIDGRQVHIYSDGTQYFVHELDLGGTHAADLPLDNYIKLVANVAMSLHRVGVSPTFVDTGSTTKLNAIKDDAGDRYRAMQLACTQAELRTGHYR